MKLFNKQDKTKKLSRKQRSRQVDQRSTSLRRFSITATVLFIAILLILNIVFDMVVGDRLRWDWTGVGLYSVGAVTREVLQDMDKDVEIVGLFDPDNDTRYTQIRPMLDEYVIQSQGRVSLRYVNPDRFPAIMDELDPEGFLNPEANQFVVRSLATNKAKVISHRDIYRYQVDYNTFTQYLTGITAEQSFTGAIKYVVSENTPVVYFTSGHEEMPIDDYFKTISSILTGNNYDVRTLDLFGLDAIPDDCSVLIMASPKRDITQATHSTIFDYLRGGGSLLLITDYSNAEFTELNRMLFEFNLELSNDRIREGDRDHRYQDDPYIIRAIAPVSKVTEILVDGFTLVDNVRGVNEIFNTRDWIEVEPVLTTTDQGVAELKSDTAQSSAPGVQNIAMLSENMGWRGAAAEDSAKVMVIGSSTMFTDQVLQAFGTNIYNASLFYSTIQFLSGEDQGESLFIEAKMPPSYVITSGNQTTNVATAVFVLLVIPAALLLAAMIIYRRRKHL